MFGEFKAGESYPVRLNGRDRSLTVLKQYDADHWSQSKTYDIRWDSGEEEWASHEDMIRWWMDRPENLIW